MKDKQKILITGASSGIGRTLFEHLKALGQDVVGTSRNKTLVENTAGFIFLDVTSEESVKACVSQFLSQYGKMDVLINNAGYGIAGPIEDTTLEESQQQLDTNFFGVVRMIRAVLPNMREQRTGLIINISSLGGMIGMPYQGFYSASKFALQGFTEALRVEVSPFNIRATNISPGDFKTDFTANRRISNKISEGYKPYFNNAMKVYLKDEGNGLDPFKIAQQVERLIFIKNRNPKANYVVASFIQRFFLLLKQSVNSNVFEWGFKLIYRQNIKP